MLLYSRIMGLASTVCKNARRCDFMGYPTDKDSQAFGNRLGAVRLACVKKPHEDAARDEGLSGSRSGAQALLGRAGLRDP